MMNIEQAINEISSMATVTGVNRWTKGNHDRLYIETEKANGGKKWNGGRGYQQLYIDLNTKTVHASGVAGAKTRAMLANTIERIKQISVEIK